MMKYNGIVKKHTVEEYLLIQGNVHKGGAPCLCTFAHCNAVYKNDGETIEYATIER